MSFKGVSEKFNGCLRKILKLFQGSFKGVSRKMEGCSWRPSSELHRYLTKVQSFRGV